MLAETSPNGSLLAANNLSDLTSLPNAWSNLGVYGKEEVAALRNRLRPRGGVAFDGSSGARVVSTLTGQTIGTDPFSIGVLVQVPTTSPSAADGYISLGATTALDSGSPVYLRVSSAGALKLTLFKTLSTVYAELTLSGFVSTYGGKVVHIVAVRPSSGDAVLYINGVAQAPTSATVGGGTWQDSISSTVMVVGSDASTRSCRSPIYSATLYNLALSAADVQEIYELGGAVPERFKFGNQGDSLITGDNSTFASDTGFWNKQTGTSITAGVGRFSAGTATQGLVRFGIGWVLGKAYRLQFTISGYSSGAVYLEGPATYSQHGANGTYTINAIAAATYLKFGATANGTTLDIDNVTLIRAGAVVHLPLNDGIGYQLHDESTNKLDALMTTTGVSHIVPRKRGYIRQTLTWSAAHDAKTLDASLPPGAILERITATANASTAGVGMGIGRNGDLQYYVGNTPLTANTKKAFLSFVNALPFSASHYVIWVDPDSVNFTGSIRFDIRYSVTEGTP